ncbi:MAG: hypothetical protein CMK59_09635 [Proteobacteria bacterium]|nr:hypothetical protein [Pseudomonadota bacterium]
MAAHSHVLFIRTEKKLPAVLCIQCKKLISSEETSCPYCNAPQQGRAVLQSRIFTDGAFALNCFVWANWLVYACCIALYPNSALSFDGGILGFGAPDSKALYLLGLTGGQIWACGHWWTLLTASFLHGSLLHIYFNMSWMKQLGMLTIAFLGPARFVNIYLLTGIGGFWLSNVWSNSPTVGASCSIFGFMGVLITFSKRRGGQFGQKLNRQMWSWAIIGLLFGLFIPMINNAGHIGGFLTGILVGYLLPSREGVNETVVERWLAVALLLITLIGFGLSITKMWDSVQVGMILCQ